MWPPSLGGSCSNFPSSQMVSFLSVITKENSQKFILFPHLQINLLTISYASSLQQHNMKISIPLALVIQQLSTVKSPIQRLAQCLLLTPIHWRAICLALLVQRLDSALQEISVNKTHYTICWMTIYPVDSVIYPSNNQGLSNGIICPLYNWALKHLTTCRKK